MLPRGLAQTEVLPQAFADDDEQRAEGGDRREPAGEWDVGGHAARNGTEKKARRHRRQLNDRLALQPEV